MIQIFLADGRDGRTGPTEGSTRGPRGPKNGISINSKQNKIATTPYRPKLAETTIICKVGQQMSKRKPSDAFDFVRLSFAKKVKGMPVGQLNYFEKMQFWAVRLVLYLCLY